MGAALGAGVTGAAGGAGAAAAAGVGRPGNQPLHPLPQQPWLRYAAEARVREVRGQAGARQRPPGVALPAGAARPRVATVRGVAMAMRRVPPRQHRGPGRRSDRNLFVIKTVTSSHVHTDVSTRARYRNRAGKPAAEAAGKTRKVGRITGARVLPPAQVNHKVGEHQQPQNRRVWWEPAAASWFWWDPCSKSGPLPQSYPGRGLL